MGFAIGSFLNSTKHSAFRIHTRAARISSIHQGTRLYRGSCTQCNFSGPIPNNGAFKSASSVSLARNYKLCGSLPNFDYSQIDECSKRLPKFDASDNAFSGSFPSNWRNVIFQSLNVANNALQQNFALSDPAPINLHPMVLVTLDMRSNPLISGNHFSLANASLERLATEGTSLAACPVPSGSAVTLAGSCQITAGFCTCKNDWWRFCSSGSFLCFPFKKDKTHSSAESNQMGEISVDECSMPDERIAAIPPPLDSDLQCESNGTKPEPTMPNEYYLCIGGIWTRFGPLPPAPHVDAPSPSQNPSSPSPSSSPENSPHLAPGSPSLSPGSPSLSPSKPPSSPKAASGASPSSLSFAFLLLSILSVLIIFC